MECDNKTGEKEDDIAIIDSGSEKSMGDNSVENHTTSDENNFMQSNKENHAFVAESVINDLTKSLIETVASGSVSAGTKVSESAENILLNLKDETANRIPDVDSSQIAVEEIILDKGIPLLSDQQKDANVMAVEPHIEDQETMDTSPNKPFVPSIVPILIKEELVSIPEINEKRDTSCISSADVKSNHMSEPRRASKRKRVLKNILNEAEKEVVSPITSKKLPVVETAIAYNLGDLVWSHVPGHPLWPCMVLNDPMEPIFTKMQGGGCKSTRAYHVQFLGDSPEHGWIRETKVFPFMGPDDYERIVKEIAAKHKKTGKAPRLEIPARLKDNWESGVDEIVEAVSYSAEERIQKFGYDFRPHMRKIYKKKVNDDESKSVLEEFMSGDVEESSDDHHMSGSEFQPANFTKSYAAETDDYDAASKKQRIQGPKCNSPGFEERSSFSQLCRELTSSAILTSAESGTTDLHGGTGLIDAKHHISAIKDNESLVSHEPHKKSHEPESQQDEKIIESVVKTQHSTCASVYDYSFEDLISAIDEVMSSSDVCRRYTAISKKYKIPLSTLRDCTIKNEFVYEKYINSKMTRKERLNVLMRHRDVLRARGCKPPPTGPRDLLAREELELPSFLQISESKSDTTPHTRPHFARKNHTFAAEAKKAGNIFAPARDHAYSMETVRIAVAEATKTGNIFKVARNHGIPESTLRSKVSRFVVSQKRKQNLQKKEIIEEHGLSEYDLKNAVDKAIKDGCLRYASRRFFISVPTLREIVKKRKNIILPGERNQKPNVEKGFCLGNDSTHHVNNDVEKFDKAISDDMVRSENPNQDESALMLEESLSFQDKTEEAREVMLQVGANEESVMNTQHQSEVLDNGDKNLKDGFAPKNEVADNSAIGQTSTEKILASDSSSVYDYSFEDLISAIDEIMSSSDVYRRYTAVSKKYKIPLSTLRDCTIKNEFLYEKYINSKMTRKERLNILMRHRDVLRARGCKPPPTGPRDLLTREELELPSFLQISESKSDTTPHTRPHFARKNHTFAAEAKKAGNIFAPARDHAYSMETVRLAVAEAAKTGNIFQVARNYGIPESTLRGKVSRFVVSQKRKQKLQKKEIIGEHGLCENDLKNAVDKAIKDGCLRYASRRFFISVPTLREIVKKRKNIILPGERNQKPKVEKGFCLGNDSTHYVNNDVEKIDKAKLDDMVRSENSNQDESALMLEEGLSFQDKTEEAREVMLQVGANEESVMNTQHQSEVLDNGDKNLKDELTPKNEVADNSAIGQTSTEKILPSDSSSVYDYSFEDLISAIDEIMSSSDVYRRYTAVSKKYKIPLSTLRDCTIKNEPVYEKYINSKMTRKERLNVLMRHRDVLRARGCKPPPTGPRDLLTREELELPSFLQILKSKSDTTPHTRPYFARKNHSFAAEAREAGNIFAPARNHSYSMETVRLAVAEATKTGNIFQVARNYGIPESTLRGKVSRFVVSQKRKQNLQKKEIIGEHGLSEYDLKNAVDKAIKDGCLKYAANKFYLRVPTLRDIVKKRKNIVLPCERNQTSRVEKGFYLANDSTHHVEEIVDTNNDVEEIDKAVLGDMVRSENPNQDESVLMLEEGLDFQDKTEEAREVMLQVGANEENVLVHTLNVQLSWNWQLSHSQIMSSVSQYLNECTAHTLKNDSVPNDWIRSFLQKNDLTPCVEDTTVELKPNPFKVFCFFNKLKRHIELLKNNPGSIYMIHEFVLQPLNEVYEVRVLAAVNAAGRKSPPLMVFKGTSLWCSSPNCYPGAQFAVSSSGEMTNLIWREWFINFCTSGKPPPQLLLYDGDTTSIPLDFVRILHEANTPMLKLPYPTSASFQLPYAEAVYGMSHGFRKTYAESINSRSDVIESVSTLWRSCFNPKEIKGVFENSGFFPFDREKFPFESSCDKGDYNSCNSAASNRERRQSPRHLGVSVPRSSLQKDNQRGFPVITTAKGNTAVTESLAYPNNKIAPLTKCPTEQSSNLQVKARMKKPSNVQVKTGRSAKLNKKDMLAALMEPDITPNKELFKFYCEKRQGPLKAEHPSLTPEQEESSMWMEWEALSPEKQQKFGKKRGSETTTANKRKERSEKPLASKQKRGKRQKKYFC